MKHVIALFFSLLPKGGVSEKKRHLPGWCDPFEVYLCAFFFLKNTEKNSNLFMFRFFVVVLSVYHCIPPEASFL